MKSLWLAKNRRGKREAPRLSLFPFLAVLICTMGALVLLLLSVTRQARLQAAREAAAKNSEKQSNIASATEMVQWRVDQLKSSRTETAAQLADARLVLGHIEDHSRRLRDQFLKLKDQATKAAAEGLKPGRFLAPGEDELRQLESQIAIQQQRLAIAQRAAANRPKSFAIVPYDGPNSTRRRPIYIECRSDAVVLQPENIAFDEADFDEPLGPGNPLAAAVRAAREQMLMQHSLDPRNDGEPYPLLLVRPDGIAAYECALAAMKSWGSEFGYELINAEWQLKYPPADPNVGRAIAQAVALARQEHARLIAAAPDKYGKRPSSGAYRSSLAGAGDQQGRGGDGGSPGFYSSKPSDRYGQQVAGGPGSGSSSGTGSGGADRRGSRGTPFGGSDSPGGSGHGIGSGSSGSGHNDGTTASADAEFAANNPYQTLALPGGTGTGGGGNGQGGYGPGGAPGSGVGSGAGYGSGGSGYGPGGYGPGGAGGGGAGPGGPGGPYMAGGPTPANGPGPGGPPGANGAPNGSGNMAGNNMNGNANGGAPNIYNSSFGQPGAQGTVPPGMQASGQPNPSGDPRAQASGGPQFSPNSPSDANGQVTTAAGMARPDGYINGRPQDGNPNQPPPPRTDPSSTAGMVAAAPLRPGEWRPSDDTKPPKPDPEEEKKKKKHPYDNIHPDHDQADWALRDARSHAAAISRPVHVDCYPDRVVIAPETPGGEPRVIMCEYDNQRNADRFVAAVWEVMDSWGMAGREMYWRPILNFYVVPGAERRMVDLAHALDGSGLVIERKQ